MMLRCSKCGSDRGFLVETADGRKLEVLGQLGTERIRKSVLVTCEYCNNRWDHVPVAIRDARLEERFEQRLSH